MEKLIGWHLPFRVDAHSLGNLGSATGLCLSFATKFLPRSLSYKPLFYKYFWMILNKNCSVSHIICLVLLLMNLQKHLSVAVCVN